MKKPFFQPKRSARSDNKGKSLLRDLVIKLDDSELQYQIEKVADHFNMSKREVVENILGRK
jgi:hypothetical protein